MGCRQSDKQGRSLRCSMVTRKSHRRRGRSESAKADDDETPRHTRTHKTPISAGLTNELTLGSVARRLYHGPPLDLIESRHAVTALQRISRCSVDAGCHSLRRPSIHSSRPLIDISPVAIRRDANTLFDTLTKSTAGVRTSI